MCCRALRFSSLLQEHCNKENVLRLLDGDSPHVVKGFSSKIMKSINEAMTLKMNPSHKPAPPQGAGFSIPGAPNETTTPGTVRG